MAAVKVTKRKDLPLSEKVNLLKALEAPGVTQVAIAKEFGVSTSQVSRLSKSKDDILKTYEESPNKDRRRQRDGKEKDVGEALYVWYKQIMVDEGARPLGSMLKQKAIELAATDGRKFSPSDGWLSRWKNRYNIVYRRKQEEKESTDFLPDLLDTQEKNKSTDFLDPQDIKKEGTDFLPDLLESFAASDIFCADETGLYYQGILDKDHSLSGDEPGGKQTEARVTALLCANMSGKEKCPLLIVGKRKHPKCFPKDLTKLPVDYAHSSNALMTGQIFKLWLQKWDRKLQLTGRHICLLLDNCTAHPSDIELTNIQLKFFPASVSKPFEIGVIKNWKGHYQSRLYARVIAALDANETARFVDVAASITLLDAMYLAKCAWNAVRPETIAKCFQKSGFVKPSTDPDEFVDVYFDSEESVDDVDVYADVELPETMTVEEFENLVSIDEDLEVVSEMTDTDLLEAVQARKRMRKEVAECSQNAAAENDDDVPGPLTIAQQMQMLSHLRQFIQENGMQSGLPFLHEAERKVFAEVKKAKKQKQSHLQKMSEHSMIKD